MNRDLTLQGTPDHFISTMHQLINSSHACIIPTFGQHTNIAVEGQRREKILPLIVLVSAGMGRRELAVAVGLHSLPCSPDHGGSCLCSSQFEAARLGVN